MLGKYQQGQKYILNQDNYYYSKKYSLQKINDSYEPIIDSKEIVKLQKKIPIYVSSEYISGINKQELNNKTKRTKTNYDESYILAQQQLKQQYQLLQKAKEFINKLKKQKQTYQGLTFIRRQLQDQKRKQKIKKMQQIHLYKLQVAKEIRKIKAQEKIKLIKEKSKQRQQRLRLNQRYLYCLPKISSKTLTQPSSSQKNKKTIIKNSVSKQKSKNKSRTDRYVLINNQQHNNIKNNRKINLEKIKKNIMNCSVLNSIKKDQKDIEVKIDRDLIKLEAQNKITL